MCFSVCFLGLGPEEATGMFFSSLNRRDRVNLVANHSRLEMVILGMDELRLVTSGNNGWRLGGWLQHFH